ncbi:NADPH-dependent FMN reductase [Paracoccus nototheniae]|uniref:NADPH-dependent FMN reductase n=1 Tax=Paracoccus nototheniae TaxID=2489002 RepID=A0ABW4E3I2_9RHOB|nr:NAD(P)H-dependent oxidoreductase [Paracoccus nototheniae]
MSKPRIAVIIGSTRKTRFADKPAAWLMEQVADHASLDFELVDLRDHDLPFFDEPASNLWMPSQDPRAVAWQEKLAGFDGYLFVVAEYNHSITGALKNALDQAYKEWNRKPMAAVAYGGVGGARAVEQLRLIAIELQMVPLRNAIHIGGGDFMAVSPMGGNAPMSAIEDHLKGSLDGMLAELTFWAELLKDAPKA